MTFFDSLPTVTEIVSSTAPQATAMFNALSPVLWFGLGVVVAIVTVAIIYNAIAGAIHWVKNHMHSSNHGPTQHPDTYGSAEAEYAKRTHRYDPHGG